ncbi:hypothetical protein NW757_014317 [Fusarium falciforme]|nr:hypothetical protein NW757_014317 [Fusarium falciforme]
MSAISMLTLPTPRRGDLTELAALHRRLTRLEARLHVGTVARQATSASKKRKQSTSASPYAKRLKDNRIVNISTTRAYVYWDDSSERCAYTWTRGRGGRCWVRDEELEDREEVDGKYLLCYDYVCRKPGKCGLAAIEVRLNGDIQVFEGWRALEAVGLSAMIQ